MGDDCTKFKCSILVGHAVNHVAFDAVDSESSLLYWIRHLQRRKRYLRTHVAKCYSYSKINPNAGVGLPVALCARDEFVTAISPHYKKGKRGTTQLISESHEINAFTRKNGRNKAPRCTWSVRKSCVLSHNRTLLSYPSVVAGIRRAVECDLAISLK